MTLANLPIPIFTGADLSARVNAAMLEVRAARRFGTIAALLADTSMAYGTGSRAIAAEDRIKTAEGLGYRIAPSSATDHHLITAGGVKLYADRSTTVVERSAPLTFSGPSSVAHLPGVVLRQANGANNAVYVTGSFSEAQNPFMSDVALMVDGNRANNATPVTGYRLTNLKKTMSRQRIGARNCEVGVELFGNVEYARIEAHVEYCTVGMRSRPNGTETSDENLIDLVAHSCGSFFVSDGASKTSGVLTIAAEGCDGYGVDIQTGWWDLRGEMRGVGRVAGGGGFRTGAGARITGGLLISGGSDTNCEWCADLQGGRLSAVHLACIASFRNGVRVAPGTEGSILVDSLSSPATAAGTMLQLGDTSGAVLNGFHVLPGSRLVASGVALDLLRATNCLIEPSQIVGTVRIDANSGGNTLHIGKRNAASVVIQNSRAALDNKVIFRGGYTLTELLAVNGGVLFRGMEAELCTNFGNARAYYDGTQWRPMHTQQTVGNVITGVSQTTGTTSGAATYDPVTGNGSTVRAASTDQNWVRISDLLGTDTIRLGLSGVTGTTPLSIRLGSATGTIVETVAVGSGATTRDIPMGGATSITLNCSNTGNTAFTGLTLAKA